MEFRFIAKNCTICGSKFTDNDKIVVLEMFEKFRNEQQDKEKLLKTTIQQLGSYKNCN